MTITVTTINATSDGTLVSFDVLDDKGTKVASRSLNFPVGISATDLAARLSQVALDETLHAQALAGPAPDLRAIAGASFSPPPLGPDRGAFEGDLRGIFADDPTVLNTLASKFPLFLVALRDGNWPYVQQYIIIARTNAIITDAQYAAIKAAAVNRLIPLTLP